MECEREHILSVHIFIAETLSTQSDVRMLIICEFTAISLHQKKTTWRRVKTTTIRSTFQYLTRNIEMGFELSHEKMNKSIHTYKSWFASCYHKPNQIYFADSHSKFHVFKQSTQSPFWNNCFLSKFYLWMFWQRKK